MFCLIGCASEPSAQVESFDIALPILLALVAVAITLKAVRTLAARRRFGTAQLTAAQRLELYWHHGAVRWLSRATTVLTMLLMGLVLQVGILATH